MPVWPSTPSYKEQHCGGYTAGQSSCTGQWLTSPAIANTLTKATVKPRPHEWINKPLSCIFQPEASAKAPSQRAHLSQQYNYKWHSVYRPCTFSLKYMDIKWHLNFNLKCLWSFFPLTKGDFSVFCIQMMSNKNANRLFGELWFIQCPTAWTPNICSTPNIMFVSFFFPNSIWVILDN